MQQPATAVDLALSLAHFGLGKSVERAKEPPVENLELRRGHLGESPGLQSESGHRSLSFVVDPADVLRRARCVGSQDLDAATSAPSKSTVSSMCSSAHMNSREN